MYTFIYLFWFCFFAGILTYLVWGFIIGYETISAMSGSTLAVEWIKGHHSYSEFYIESIIFYPMILLGYLFLEMIPHYLFRAQEFVPFDLQKVFDKAFGSSS